MRRGGSTLSQRCCQRLRPGLRLLRTHCRTHALLCSAQSSGAALQQHPLLPPTASTEGPCMRPNKHHRPLAGTTPMGHVTLFFFNARNGPTLIGIFHLHSIKGGKKPTKPGQHSSTAAGLLTPLPERPGIKDLLSAAQITRLCSPSPGESRQAGICRVTSRLLGAPLLLLPQ